MATISLKKVTQAFLDEIIGGWYIDDVIPNGGSEGGPVKKEGDQYAFEVTYCPKARPTQKDTA